MVFSVIPAVGRFIWIATFIATPWIHCFTQSYILHPTEIIFSMVHNISPLLPALSAIKASESKMRFAIDNLPVVSNEKPIADRTSLIMLQNYPNPFEKTMIISWLSRVKPHSIRSIYDPMGNVIAILANKKMPAGKHKITFEDSLLAEGIFYYRLRANGRVETRKMVVCD